MHLPRASVPSVLGFVLGLVALVAAPAAADELVTAGDGYSVTISTSKPSTANRATEVTVVLVPTMGFKVNEEYPISLRVTAPDDVHVPAASLDRSKAKLSTKKAEFRVPMTPRAAGDKTLTFAMRFAVCTETTCDPRKETMTFKLRVR